MTGYLNGDYLPLDEIGLSPLDRGWLFADALYEVVRSYSGRLFEVERHVSRLECGARELRFRETTFPWFAEVACELVTRNALTDGEALVYVQVSRGAAPRSHRFPSPDTPPTVLAYAHRYERPPDIHDSGASAIVLPDTRWARCDIKSVSLLANTLAHETAREQDAYEAILVRDGMVTEGTRSSVLVVADGTVVGPPRSSYILDGVTRRVVREMCADLSIPYAERDISERSLAGVDEIMVTGTASDIVPIVRLGDRDIGSGTPGPITRALQEEFARRTGSAE